MCVVNFHDRSTLIDPAMLNHQLLSCLNRKFFKIYSCGWISDLQPISQAFHPKIGFSSGFCRVSIQFPRVSQGLPWGPTLTPAPCPGHTQKRRGAATVIVPRCSVADDPRPRQSRNFQRRERTRRGDGFEQQRRGSHI